MGIVIVYLQKLVYVFPTFKWLSILDYNKVNLLLLGFLLGLGAMIGDVVGSFFKRQVNIAPGKPWLPFDQTDFILGGLLLMLFVYVPSWQTTLIILVLGFILHILFNLASYSLGFQKNML